MDYDIHCHCNPLTRHETFFVNVVDVTHKRNNFATQQFEKEVKQKTLLGNLHGNHDIDCNLAKIIQYPGKSILVLHIYFQKLAAPFFVVVEKYENVGRQSKLVGEKRNCIIYINMQTTFCFCF